MPTEHHSTILKGHMITFRLVFAGDCSFVIKGGDWGRAGVLVDPDVEGVKLFFSPLISFLSSGICDFLDERGTVEGFGLYRCLRSIPYVRISHREGREFPIRPSAVTLSFGQLCVELGLAQGRF